MIRYTKKEEIWNTFSHGGGVLLGVVVGIIFLVWCFQADNNWARIGVILYLFGMLGSYIASTLYHAITNRKAKAFFRIMDHNTIFFLIAGTYTPITLVPLRGAIGWVIFGIVWAAAILGIVLNSIDLEKFRKPSVVCYILMGWAIIFAIKPMLESVPKMTMVFLLIGGAFYTVGVIFYAIKKVKYFHSVWHLFTIGGTVFHFFAILIMVMHCK